MKLLSWLNDITSPNPEESEGEPSEPSLSPLLKERFQELEKVKVRDAMVPRALVTALDADVQLRRVRRLKSAKVAYFPVYKGDLDHILGWVSKQKVLELLSENSEENTLAANAKDTGMIDEDATIPESIEIFLKSASPFLVVKNSHGTTTGILPLTEVVELLFGFELSPAAQPVVAENAAPLLRGYEL